MENRGLIYRMRKWYGGNASGSDAVYLLEFNHMEMDTNDINPFPRRHEP